MKRRFWLGLPLLVVAACQAGGNASGPNMGAAGANGSAGSTSTPPGSFDLACNQATVGKPVLRLLTRAQLTRTIDDIFPQLKGTWSSTLPADPVSGYGFDNDAAAVVGPQLAQGLFDTASSIGAALTGNALTQILPCASAGDRACAEQFVTQYGRRLFRRALSDSERARYLTFFDGALGKSDFKTAIKWLTVGLIQSPNAVYRSELGAVAGDSRTLSQSELATEIAYTFTGSTPSEALLAQAESGTPLDPAALAKQLVTSDAGKATLSSFFDSYLDYARVASIERSNIPQWGSVRGPMLGETRAFIDQIVFQNHAGLRELLTSSTSNPSRALADYYGFPPPASDYASVQRTAGQGVGLLAQGAVLATRALPNGSSPTQRGLLVFSKLLCNTKPSPPPNVPALGEPQPGLITTRQRYETQHANSPVCQSCHKLFDPIGFGFEHFDEGGRYRETEGVLPIDSASNVPTQSGTPLFEFAGQESLANGLAEQTVVYQCFSAYLATYAFGTGQACLGSSRVNDLKAGTLGIADYYAALAAEPHFTRRAAR